MRVIAEYKTERVTPLLRFYSSRPGGDQELTSLADYAGRMKPEQRTIYYLLGDDVRESDDNRLEHRPRRRSAR